MTARLPTRAAGSGIRRGQVLGERYEVRDRLTADAFSVGLLALDHETEGQVLLRVVRPGILPRSEDRHEVGAKLRAAVGYGGNFLPGLADADVDDDRVFVVEALPKGASLRDLLTRRSDRERRLRPAEALPIAARLDAGLASVPAGFWHGEVQAAHIWLSAEGMVLTNPFLVAALPPRVVTSVLNAHPSVRRHYAPEVLDGNGGPASDRYAAALTLYEALTGAALPQPGAAMPAGLGGVGDAIAALLHADPSRRPENLRDLVAALARQAGVAAPRIDPGTFRPSPTGARAALGGGTGGDDWDDATALWEGSTYPVEPSPPATWEAEDTQTDAPVARIEAPVMEAGTFPMAPGTQPDGAPAEGWDDEATQQVSLDELLASPEVVGTATSPGAAPAPAAADESLGTTVELELDGIDAIEVVEVTPPPRKVRPVHKPDLASMGLKPIPRARNADSIPPAAPSDWTQGEAPVLFDDSRIGEYEPTDPTGSLPGPLQPPTFEEFTTSSNPPPPAPVRRPEPSVGTPPALMDTVVPSAEVTSPGRARAPHAGRFGGSAARRLTVGSLLAGILLVASAIGWSLYRKHQAELEHSRRLQERLEQIQNER